jgi:hypothetical protein
VARNGTTAEYVWFLADASGRIIRRGDSQNEKEFYARAEGEVLVFAPEYLRFNGHPVTVMYGRTES